jgi:prefoldin subunit 5
MERRLQEAEQRLKEAQSQDDTSIPKLQQQIRELEKRLAKYERQDKETDMLVSKEGTI